MIEEQAMSRIYRMGQKRNVKLVRYRIRDSFEEVSAYLTSSSQTSADSNPIESSFNSKPEERPRQSGISRGETV